MEATKLAKLTVKANLQAKAREGLEEEVKRRTKDIERHYREMDIPCEVFTGKTPRELAEKQLNFEERRVTQTEIFEKITWRMTKPRKIEWCEDVMEHTQTYSAVWKECLRIKKILEEE